MTGIRSSFVLLAVLTGPQPWIGMAAAADTPRQGAIELAADQSGTGAASDANVRKRAEDLAGAASERFTQILSDKDKAAGQDEAEKTTAAAPQDGSDDSIFAPVWDWLAQASKEYQDVIIVKLRDPKSEPAILTAPEAPKETPAAPTVTAQAPEQAPEQAPSEPQTAAPSEPESAPSLQWGSITTTIQEWLARANRSYRNEIVKKLRSPQEGPAGAPEPGEAPKAVVEQEAPPAAPEAAPAEEEAPVAQTQTGVDLPVANPKRVAETERKAEAEKQRVAEAADAKRKADEAEKQRLADEAEAARKAEDEKQRLAAEAEAKRKADEAEAERKRLAEAEAEKQRLAAEAEAKRQADEAEAERKRLAEEEAARKAEAEKQRLAAEAETKRKADEAEVERKRLAEAEAARKAEAEKQRIADEAEAKRKAAAAQVERPERKPAPEKAPETPPEKSMEVARAGQPAAMPEPPARESSKLAVDETGGAPDKPEPAPPVAERKPQRMAEAEGDASEARPRAKRHVAKKHHRKRHAAKSHRRKRAHVHAYRRKRYAKPRPRRHCECRYRRRCGHRVRHYRSAEPGGYVVRRGDTLWGIARRHYGNGEGYRRIYRANRGRIRNPNRIYVNQRIYLP